MVLDIDTGSDQFNQWTESTDHPVSQPAGPLLSRRRITMRRRRRRVFICDASVMGGDASPGDWRDSACRGVDPGSAAALVLRPAAALFYRLLCKFTASASLPTVPTSYMPVHRIFIIPLTATRRTSRSKLFLYHRMDSQLVDLIAQAVKPTAWIHQLP